ncbi:MAG: ATP-grasp domain-containing protein, partial [Anaerolineales bacterium]|nr:ATP-grasp domain-containing protein [Anaerolineales bacterium]
MFKKILVANRGEIAVRILRTCRDLGLLTVAVYERPDRGSLHVRLADEAVELTSPAGFSDAAALLAIARQTGADAVHPGYGFLAEQADFSAACQAAGLAFIGPPAAVTAILRDKITTLTAARAYGYPTLPYSMRAFAAGETDALRAEADRLGYPVVIKALIGGRGRGERLARDPERLAEALERAQAEAQAIYADPRVYLEKA